MVGQGYVHYPNTEQGNIDLENNLGATFSVVQLTYMNGLSKCSSRMNIQGRNSKRC